MKETTNNKKNRILIEFIIKNLNTEDIFKIIELQTYLTPLWQMKQFYWNEKKILGDQNTSDN